MKKHIVKVYFNINSVENPILKEIFSSKTSKVLWLMIRNNHVTDQYFNNQVLYVSKIIRNLGGVMGYYDFLGRIQPLSYSYGRISISHTVSEIDHKFWGDIYNILKGEDSIEIIEV